MDNCTCDIRAIDDADPDPFCLVHPADQKVFDVWIEGWHRGVFDPPGEDELLRLAIIQSLRLQAVRSL